MIDLTTNCVVIKMTAMTRNVMLYLRRKRSLRIPGLVLLAFLLLIYNDCQPRYFQQERMCPGSRPNCSHAIKEQQPVIEHQSPVEQDIRRNETWMKLRENIVGKDRVAKVILFSYTRGGSTLLSDVFNIKSDSTYLWYEALQGFHSFYSGIPEYSNELRLLYYRNHTRRTVDARKFSAMTDYLDNLLQCRIDRIPITTLSHVFMTKSAGYEDFWSCMESKNGSSRLSSCQRMIELYCYAEKYWSDYLKHNPSAGVTKMTCEDLIATIATWKLKSRWSNKVIKLLLKYLKKTGLRQVKSYVEENCPKLDASSWKEIQASTMEGKQLNQTQNKASHKSREEFQECTSMLIKFTNFLRQQDCLRSLDHDTRHCRDAVNQRCGNADVIAINIHRSSLVDLELLIQRIPNINIVYYVRDPRAIAVSRAERYLHTYEPSRTWTIGQEAQFICVRMQDDLTAMKNLERKYPGSLMLVRYEDLVRYPVDTVTRMFRSFGRSLKRETLERWVETVFHARKDNGMYGVERRNGSVHISKWRSLVTEEDRSTMTEHCRSVLEELQYET